MAMVVKTLDDIVRAHCLAAQAQKPGNMQPQVVCRCALRSSNSLGRGCDCLRRRDRHMKMRGDVDM